MKAKRKTQSAVASVAHQKNGGHRWTLRLPGRVITTDTSSASVSVITSIGIELAPALRSLAKK